MSRNRMPEVAKMLGVELGEAFKLEICEDVSTYCFDGEGLACDKVIYYCDDVLRRLLNGELDIIKLPWKPKHGNVYYFVDRDGDVGSASYDVSCSQDRAMYKSGNCFKTKDEITQEVISRILKDFWGKEVE